MPLLLVFNAVTIGIHSSMQCRYQRYLKRSHILPHAPFHTTLNTPPHVPLHMGIPPPRPLFQDANYSRVIADVCSGVPGPVVGEEEEGGEGRGGGGGGEAFGLPPCESQYSSREGKL